jgi:hypothetical protein
MCCGASDGRDCAELGTGTPYLQGRNFGRSSVESSHPSNLPEETKRSENRPLFRNLLEGFVLSMQSSYSQYSEPALSSRSRFSFMARSLRTRDRPMLAPDMEHRCQMWQGFAAVFVPIKIWQPSPAGQLRPNEPRHSTSHPISVSPDKNKPPQTQIKTCLSLSHPPVFLSSFSKSPGL